MSGGEVKWVGGCTYFDLAFVSLWIVILIWV